LARDFVGGVVGGVVLTAACVAILAPDKLPVRVTVGPFEPSNDSILLPTSQRVAAVKEFRDGWDQLRVRAECRGMDEALELLRRGRVSP